MFRYWKVPAIALLAALTLVPACSAQRRSVVFVRGGYGYYGQKKSKGEEEAENDLTARA